MAGINLTLLLSGIAVTGVTIAVFIWGLPKEGRPSRIPDKWGLSTAFPIVVMGFGLLGCILIAKGLFP